MRCGLLVRVVALVTLAFLSLPLLIVVAASFTASGYLSFPPEGLSLEWYGRFLADSSYISSMLLSAGLALAAAAVAALIGVPAAIGLRKSDQRLSAVLQMIFLSPLALPGIVIGAALFHFTAEIGLGRTFWALLVGHSVICAPYVVRTTLAALDDELARLEDAADDLGASRAETFLLVTLPSIKPGVMAGVLLAFIISWINVEVSMFSTTSALMPIPVKMFNYVQYNVDPLIAAVSALTIYVALFAVVVVDRTIGLEKVAVSRN